ncbi:MAG: hypothetical protein V1891_04105 [bacterium]
MKKIYIFLSIILFFTVAIVIPKVFIKDLIQPSGEVRKCAIPIEDKEAEKCCIAEENAIPAVQLHFDHPIQRLLTFKTTITQRADSFIIVSGYTFFGIKFTEAKFSCEGVETIKSFIF